MRTAPLRWHFVAGLLAAAVAVAVAVLVMHRPADPRVKSANPEELQLSWVAGGDELAVDGAGFRPKASTDIRIGSRLVQHVRADPNGRVQLRVPRGLLAAGQSGASIVVAGRSRFGVSRMLVSAVPPPAAARGPVDALPWAVAALVLTWLGLGLLYRLRNRAPAGAGPPRS